MLSVILILEAKENSTKKQKQKEEVKIMDRETISYYGWIVVSLMVGIMLITAATPLGLYAREQTEQITNDLVNSAFEEETGMALKTPTANITVNILTIDPVEGATAYEVRNGKTLLTTTTETTVDLSEYVKSEGIHVIKVVAVSSEGTSAPCSVGYRCEKNSYE